jgi:hypothetical protein
LRSIRSYSRARTDRGIVLISALVLAILYFALMELLMIDSARALAEARRFRARIIAANLAENGAELAALYITTRNENTDNRSDEWGSMSGQMRRNDESFTIRGTGDVTGTDTQSARVSVQGRVEPNGTIRIDYTRHGQ